jgi:hypothetical protein
LNPYNTVVMKSRVQREADDIVVQYSGNPVLIQSNFGRRGNFEMISSFSSEGPSNVSEPPFGGGGLVHFFRNNDNEDLPWSNFTPVTPFPFPPIPPTIDNFKLPKFETLTFIQSNFGSDNFSRPANFEVIGRIRDRLKHIWRESRYPFYWRNTNTFLQIDNIHDLTEVTGNPSLIQSTFGDRHMNFELCVPLIEGGIYHIFKINDGDDPGSAPWQIGNNGIPIDSRTRYQAVSLIQSNYGRPENPGNLELVARTSNKLAYFWMESNNPPQWHGPLPMRADGREIRSVTGVPSLIQSNFGRRGNFELVEPVRTGGLVHYFRDNDSAGDPQENWHTGNNGRTIDPTRRYQAVSLLQSNIRSDASVPGNLEVAALSSEGLLLHFWMDSETKRWNGPYDFASF